MRRATLFWTALTLAAVVLLTISTTTARRSKSVPERAAEDEDHPPTLAIRREFVPALPARGRWRSAIDVEVLYARS